VRHTSERAQRGGLNQCIGIGISIGVAVVESIRYEAPFCQAGGLTNSQYRLSGSLKSVHRVKRII
jgi:hypothetical protein